MKTSTTFTFLILMFGLLACHKAELKSFDLPELSNSLYTEKDTIHPFVAENIEGVFPLFVGKFAFQKELDINPHLADTVAYEDFIEAYSKKDIPDSLDINGLDLRVDYETTVAYNPFYKIWDSTALAYFPVYFINSSQEDKVLYGKDGHVFGIQEAVDREHHNWWHPIESRGFDFCGNGKWGLIIHPQ